MKNESRPALNWDHIRVFQSVARNLSLAAAAVDLKISQSTIHRRLLALEASLGTQLFVRHPTGHSLTDAGERLLEYAERFDETVLSIRRDIGEQDFQVTGTVRVSTTHVGSDFILLPALPRFLERYPEISLEIDALPQAVDLLRAEANVALRFARPNAGDLVIRKIGVMPCSLFATDTVVKEYGLLRAEDAYKLCPYVGWTQGFTDIFLSTWLRRHFANRRPLVALNTVQAHVEAAKQNLGIVNLPCFIGEQQGLRDILPRQGTGALEAWLVTPKHIRRTRKIEVVAEFISEATRAVL